MKYLVKILLALAITNLNAQNVAHFCIGSVHNFGVSENAGSIYDWKLNDLSIAEIISGNGTNLINIQFNNTGQVKLFVEETDVNGCRGSDSISIEVHNLPQPFIYSTTTEICKGDSLLLQLDSSYVSVLWNTNDIEDYIYVYETGTYQVEVTDSFGCKSLSNVVSITSYDSLEADFIAKEICLQNPTILLDNTTVFDDQVETCTWFFENGIILEGDSISFNFSRVGEHEIGLQVITSKGCSDSISKSIQIKNPLKADFGYTPNTLSTYSNEINFYNNTDNSIPLLWDFGDSNFSYDLSPTHLYDSPGIYNVLMIIEDLNNCTDSITKQIIMYYDFVLHVPTSFTPNNDGVNDIFLPSGFRMNKYQSYALKIYNSWGEKIFESDSMEEGWDGKNAIKGTYNWVIFIRDELGELRKRYGTVTLVK